jgi:hypothetical protein
MERTTLRSSTYNDFKRKKETRRVNDVVPVKYAFVDDLNDMRMLLQSGLLDFGKTETDFDDFVSGSFVYFGIFMAKVVENVKAQGTISSTHFVNYEIFVRKVAEKVFGG